jgi:hypothetical protein
MPVDKANDCKNCTGKECGLDSFGGHIEETTDYIKYGRGRVLVVCCAMCGCYLPRVKLKSIKTW